MIPPPLNDLELKRILVKAIVQVKVIQEVKVQVQAEVVAAKKVIHDGST